MKKYLDATTGHDWKIIPGEKVYDDEVGWVIDLRKELKELNDMEIKNLVGIIDTKGEYVKNAIKYNNYNKFEDYEKYLIIKHTKMAKRIIDYLDLHKEYPELSLCIFGEVENEREIAIKISEMSSAQWGALIKRINIAYNIVIGIENKVGLHKKTYLKTFETKVFEKIYSIGEKLKNKTVMIKELIEEVQKEYGIRLKFEEIKRVISAMYNYVSREMKTKKEDANIIIKGVDEKLKQFIKVFKNEERKSIEDEIIEKAKNGINEMELWEYIVEVMKYPEEVYEKTIEKLKYMGTLLEPRRGFFISE